MFFFFYLQNISLTHTFKCKPFLSVPATICSTLRSSSQEIFSSCSSTLRSSNFLTSPSASGLLHRWQHLSLSVPLDVEKLGFYRTITTIQAHKLDQRSLPLFY
mmetsp:Transcript_25805/g.51827  ORF Transcript_25805/g.51827 Transcript_25805/m.51827 type:complete len:103 (-) Transcript_25805:17-325(-)